LRIEIKVAGCWLLVARFWLLVPGCWFLVAGSWLLVAGSWLLVIKGQEREDHSIAEFGLRIEIKVAGCSFLVAGC
jgi:hypothetical protein